MHYLFDDTFTGFLTAIFESFERKEWEAIPVSAAHFQSGMFEEQRTIVSCEHKAKRVMKGLTDRCGKAAMDFYRVFLSEDARARGITFRLIRKVFREGTADFTNYGDAEVLYFAQMLHQVRRERHRMQAFVRFKKSSDGLYVASIEPDFDVLPLLGDFFCKRYADQHWCIYDVKRKYGLHYDQKSVRELSLLFSDKEENTLSANRITLDEKEAVFEQCWKTYFRSTNIESRKNLKLHLQHVPKRYWKYLPEKSN